MTDDKILGIDIGATKVHIGVVQGENIIEEGKFSTSSKAPKEQIVQEIIEGIEKLMSPDIVGIGIGAPGLIDDINGIIYDVQNIDSWQEVHLKKYLEDHFKKPVYITNDANIFALGEKVFGEAKPYSNVVGLTLGTGLGTGIIIDSKIYAGAYSCAGELGGISYLDLTVEDYCSGKFFNQRGLKGLDVHDMAKQGDQEALGLFKEYGGHLGNLIKTVLYTLSPQAIFLGGSVSKCYPFFKEAMENSVNEFPYKRVLNQLLIAPSKMENAAILGAAALVKTKMA